MKRLVSAVNRNAARNGRPFDPSIVLAPPRGVRGSWVHYGVLAPNLPEPHRSFGMMSIVGTPGTTIFANDAGITTTARDTAYLIAATAAMRENTFHTYSISKSCEFAADGSLVRFDDALTLTGRYPNFELHCRHDDADVTMRIEATDKVSWFIDLRGGLYSHWSLLRRYDGDFGGTASSGLCTLEYARGIGLHSLPLPGAPRVPSTFFTYHVLNVDAKTQMLYAEARGPGGVLLLRQAYVRGIDDYGRSFDDVNFVVDDYAPEPMPTPTGSMRAPTQFHWAARDGGAPVIDVHGTPHGDWAYGLGAGFSGSYRYTGTFMGHPIEGNAYMEYVAIPRPQELRPDP